MERISLNIEFKNYELKYSYDLVYFTLFKNNTISYSNL